MTVLIKRLFYKGKWIAISISVILSFTIFMLIHNYDIYNSSSYSLNSIISKLPSFIINVLLLKNINLDSFKDYYKYFFSGIALIIIAYSYIKGYLGIPMKHYYIDNLRLSRKCQFSNFFLEFIIELLIIIIPFILISYLGNIIYVKASYLLILKLNILLYIMAIMAYFLGFLIHLFCEKKSFILISVIILLIIINICYLNQMFNSSTLSIISILGVFRQELDIAFYFIAVSIYIAISLILGLVSFFIYTK